MSILTNGRDATSKNTLKTLKRTDRYPKTTFSNYSSAFNLSWRLTYVSICSWWLSVYHQEVLRASSRFSWQRAPNLTPDSPSETAGWETAGKKEQHSFKKRKSQPCWTPLKLLKSNTTLHKDNITSKLPKAYRRWFWKSAQARNEITHHP